MMKNKNTILLIAGIILAVIILNNYGNLGLFSTQQVCVSNGNEPTTREEWGDWMSQNFMSKGIWMTFIPEKVSVAGCSNGYFPCEFRIDEINLNLGNKSCEETFNLGKYYNLSNIKYTINNKNLYTVGDIYCFCTSNDKLAICYGSQTNLTDWDYGMNKYFEDFYTCQITDEGNGEEDCIFKLNTFCVKLWMLLTGLGIIILIIFMKKI